MLVEERVPGRQMPATSASTDVIGWLPRTVGAQVSSTTSVRSRQFVELLGELVEILGIHPVEPGEHER